MAPHHASLHASRDPPVIPFAPHVHIPVTSSPSRPSLHHPTDPLVPSQSLVCSFFPYPSYLWYQCPQSLALDGPRLHRVALDNIWRVQSVPETRVKLRDSLRSLAKNQKLQRKPIDAAQENHDALSNDASDADINDFTADLEPGDEDYIPSDAEPDIVPETPDLTHGTEMLVGKSRQCILADATAERLYANWKELIPTLVSPYLHYMSRTIGKPLPPYPQCISLCKNSDCACKHTQLLGLLFDRHSMPSSFDS
ncbi:hypothetical protein JVT61DRAFT_14363 [Boletus reticuloceps]|uniref:Uncharacterized protein n=1 Tax=Boletus reticuloceps TaxID=495285 RepID=A0A8I3A2B7_9AGAM|nr:hypothetical protein JVT61DRAFT_14363 [Boletus reticuloceps]